MTPTEIKAVAKGIIKKIERRGGNSDLHPEIYKDGIAVDYTTDCDRLGNVGNREEDYLVGLRRATRVAVVDAMKKLIAEART